MSLSLAMVAKSQVVNDGETNTLSNSTNSYLGSLIVGTNGSFTELNVINGALLANSGGGHIGRNAGANSNRVTVAAAGSRWNVGSDLFVGNSGAANALVITNGGRVANAIGYIGADYVAARNAVIVTGTNSLWTNSGTLWVGFGGSSNKLLVASGGTVANDSAGISWSSAASNNQVIVTGSNARWANRFELRVGTSGAFNTLLVADGGQVTNSGSYVGDAPTATNNRVIVTGAHSQWANSSLMRVGYRSSGNSLLIADGGRVGSRDSIIGDIISISNNQVMVTGAGTLWTNWGSMTVGYSGSLNGLLITNGGRLASVNSYVGVNASASNNQVVVTGPNSTWTNNSTTLVGDSGSCNTLLISNAGAVFDSTGYVGYNAFASNNQVIVTGNGSSWVNGSTLYLGYSGSSNVLQIVTGGAVDAAQAFLGFNSSSSNNLLMISLGKLTVTNANGTAALDIRRSSAVFDGGTVTVDRLLLSSGSKGQFIFNSGIMNIRSSAVANGAVFTVGNGADAAKYNMNGGVTSSHSFSQGLVVSSNACLSGNGTVVHTVTVAAGGVLAPGTSAGRIVLNYSPVLQGSVAMDICGSIGTLTNDLIQVMGALTYGGSLIVSKLCPDALVAGDSFQLFSAASYSGGFTNIILPMLSSSLTWTNKLLVDGSIAVLGLYTPFITNVKSDGTNLIFSVTGGTPAGNWDLLTSTNVVLPVSGWLTTSSGVFDGLGNVNLTNSINFVEPRRFFRIRSL